MAAAQPPRKIILFAHGHGHPSHVFKIPPRLAIKYFGELGKYCSIQTKTPAKRICSGKDIVPRAVHPVSRAYIEEPPPFIEKHEASSAPLECNEEGCSFATANQNTLTRHVYSRHVPRGSYNNMEPLVRYFRESRKNRGYILNTSKQNGQYMLYSPRITKATLHPEKTIFPNLFIGTDEQNKGTLNYRKTTVEECEGHETRLLINLEDYINFDGRIREEIQHPFTTMKGRTMFTLYDIVSFIEQLYLGERVDLYIIACLDGIPKTSIELVQESLREAERPWRGLINLGEVALSEPHLPRYRARSRSANRRNNRNTRNRFSASSAKGQRVNSRSAARPHAKDE